MIYIEQLASDSDVNDYADVDDSSDCEGEERVPATESAV